ncbi:MAG: leucine-rich repeat domain-containing protein [Candidatus Hermodarchaeota archaeon]
MPKDYIKYKRKKYKLYKLNYIIQLQIDSCGLNSIEQIEELKSLTHLQGLHIYDNQLTEITGLENLVNLELLNLAGNQITEIKGIEHLTKLRWLYFGDMWGRGNKITEIKGLEKLTKLHALDLSNNQITEIKGLDKLKLIELNLENNQITEIKGLEKHTGLITLNLSGNPIPNDLFEKLGGLNSMGAFKSAKRVVEFCKLGGVKVIREKEEREKQKREKEEYERLMRENGCEICKKEIKKYECPDCGRSVCMNCWDENTAICIPCKKKLEFLKEGATPTPIKAVQSSQTNIISDKERFLKLRNALQMSKKVPISALTKSLSFSSADDLSAWLFEVGIVGLEIDYDSNMVKITKPEALEMLEMLINE